LDETKLSFDEYDNLHQLYKLDYQKFIDYNIKDVHLVLALEDKLKLIELALTLAYDTKSNFGDVFAQTRMWDALIYNYLLDKNIVVPPRRVSKKSEAFEGAYVKDPQVGLHDYVASFDLNSLYPHLIMQYTVSPENIIDRSYIEERKRKLIEEINHRNTK
jgi:DNA polymerase elongation subunit (family B)